MKRKLLALFLVLSMCVGIFAGCSNGDSGSSSSSAGGGESSTADTSSEAGSEASTGDTAGKQTDGKNLPELTTEPLDILFWDISTEDPSKTMSENAVARFMEDYPNINVEVVHQQNDNYKQQLIVAMSSGQCPDMYIHWGGGPMAEYYESGFVNDITEMYNTYDHPAFIEASIAQSTYEDKILAIPFGGLSGCDIFYNKTIFEEVGVEVPETIDELEAVCDKLLEAGYTPFSLANSPGWTGSMYFMYLVARHSGNDEFDAAYTQEGSFTSDAFIYAGEKIQEWVEKGYFPEDAEAAANGVPQDVEVGTAIGNGFSFNCWNEDGSVDQTKLDACYVLATQYFNDDTWNQEKIDNLTIPSIEGYEDSLDDPNMTTVAEVFFNASNVQLWYDQYLPASVTEVHKDCMNALFGLESTPQEIGEQHDAAMQEYLASR